MIRKILSILLFVIGALGIIASILLYFFGKWSAGYLSTGGVRTASFTSWETAWFVFSYFAFFLLLIALGWFIRRRRV